MFSLKIVLVLSGQMHPARSTTQVALAPGLDAKGDEHIAPFWSDLQLLSADAQQCAWS